MFELVSKSPESVNMKSFAPKLEQAVHSRHKNINGMMVLRKGYVVYENYFNGLNHSDTHTIASVTKSFTSALIGIAIDKGLIKSVDQKVFEFFPEYKTDLRDIVKRTVTIKHLLTMTAPFPWKVDPLDRLRRQKNWVNYILDQLGCKNNIGQFKYSTGGTHLLSAIITKVSGKSAREFANEHLFKPIGINEIPDNDLGFSLDDVFGKNVTGWIKDPQGVTTGGWGLNLTARDLARFGLLYLNKGKCHGKQIISEEWVKESTAMNDNKYGYLWWLIDEDNIKGYTAAGSGGNHIYAIPDEELVVVVAAGIRWRAKERFPLIKNHVIPAVLP